MVLMKAQDKQQLEAMRQQCGQERDLQVKQVEGGFVIQSVTRFFMDQGSGPVQVGEISDTTVATSAQEAGIIASNFMRHGEFWPEDGPLDLDLKDVVTDMEPQPTPFSQYAPVSVDDAIMPEQAYYREKGSNVMPDPQPIPEEVQERKPSFYEGLVPPLPIAGKDV